MKVGDRFHYLVVTEIPGRGRWVIARCDCGTVKRVRAYYLLEGTTKACGCFRAKSHATHGMKTSPEYNSWQAMKSRCTLPRHPSYKRYGGRGVKVCDEWVNSFEAFFRDMGPRPSLEYTIERRDNNGNYAPENCYWADRKTQANNTRQNRLITHNGESKTLSKWADSLGVSADRIRGRLDRGWTIEDALLKSTKVIQVEHDGRVKTIPEWSRITGLPSNAIRLRLCQGWTADRALTTPLQRRAISRMDF